MLVQSIAVPLVIGLTYLWLFATASIGGALPEGGNFTSLAGVMAFFTSPVAATAGWIHYLVFDLFVGAWQVRDAQARGISHLAVVPCLILTLLAGPVGLAALSGVAGRNATRRVLPGRCCVSMADVAVDTFSYAAPDDPRLKRFLIRADRADDGPALSEMDL